MPLTFIDTNKLPRTAIPGAGEYTEILNEALCGAKNGVVSLRWLKAGDKFKAEAFDKHQLIYLMDGDGKGRINLNDKNYDVGKGAGVYLAPSESATIEATNGALKLFHVVVPRIPK